MYLEIQKIEAAKTELPEEFLEKSEKIKFEIRHWKIYILENT